MNEEGSLDQVGSETILSRNRKKYLEIMKDVHRSTDPSGTAREFAKQYIHGLENEIAVWLEQFAYNYDRRPPNT